MDVVVCHISALHYWLSHPGGPDMRTLCADGMPQPTFPLREAQIARAVSILPKERQNERLHLLGKSHHAVKDSRAVALHTTSLELAPTDFHRAAPNVFVCSPEFALIQSAPSLSDAEFLRVAFALCGTYRSVDSDAFPLTTPMKINQAITHMARLRGAKCTRRLAPHIMENAASPRETALVLHLCLPYRLGGYGFPHPELNAVVKLDERTKRLAGKQYLSPDLFWRQAKIAVEYDSDEWHTASTRIARDAQRRSIFTHLGITEICVTRRQFNDLVALDKVARVLARQLHHRIHPRDNDFRKKQIELRKQLIAPLFAVRK